MPKVNGKNKGNTFERKIANLLSKRFKDRLGIDQGFSRNPDSGSFFGGTNQKRKDTHNLEYAVFGDLICPRSFKFTIECKHYKTAPSFQSIVKGSVSDWDKWLSQAHQDAENSDKDFMLIVKYNNVDEMVFTNFLIDGLSTILTYKEKHVYRMADVLQLDDNFFFN